MSHLRRVCFTVAVCASAYSHVLAAVPGDQPIQVPLPQSRAEPGEAAVPFEHGLFPRSRTNSNKPQWQIISRRLHAIGTPAVRWLDDDKRIVVESDTGLSCVLDTKTWETVGMLPPLGRGHKTSAAQSPDGRWIVTADHNRHRLYFRLSNGEHTATGALSSPTRLNWDLASRRVVAVENNRRITIWLANGVMELDVGEIPSIICTTAWSPSGNQLAASNFDGMVYVWELPPVGASESSPNHIEQILRKPSRKFSFDTEKKYPFLRWASEDTLTTQSSSGPITLWSTDGKKKHTIERPERCTPKWSPDRRALAIRVGSRMEICRPDGTKVIKTTDLPESYSWFAWSEDSQRLAILARPRELFIWDVYDQDKPVQVATATEDDFNLIVYRPVQWTPDGKRLTSGSRDAAIRIWNSNGTPAKSWATPGKWTHQISMLPSGEQLFSYSWPERRTRIWNLDGAETVMETEVSTNTGMQWRPDGKEFVTLNQQRALFRNYDVSGKLLQTGQHGDGNKTIDAAWSPDGTWLATTSNDQQPSLVHLWRGDGSPPRTLSGTSDPIASLAWHPDGKRLTTISKANGQIQHWNLEGKEGDPIAAIGSDGNICWSPNGKWLAACTKSRICVYNVDNQEIANFIAPVAHDRDYVAWSPDSSRLLTQTSDGVHVYDLQRTPSVELNGPCLEPRSATWSPDGTKIACPTQFNTVIVWDATTGQVEWVGLPLEDAKSATVTADGRLLTNDRDAFDKQYCFVMKDAKGKTVFLNSREFKATNNPN